MLAHFFSHPGTEVSIRRSLMNEPWYPGRPMQPEHGQHGITLLHAAAVEGGVAAHNIGKHHVCGSGSQIVRFLSRHSLEKSNVWDDKGQMTLSQFRDDSRKRGITIEQ